MRPDPLLRPRPRPVTRKRLQHRIRPLQPQPLWRPAGGAAMPASMAFHNASSWPGLPGSAWRANALSVCLPKTSCSLFFLLGDRLSRGLKPLSNPFSRPRQTLPGQLWRYGQHFTNLLMVEPLNQMRDSTPCTGPSAWSLGHPSDHPWPCSPRLRVRSPSPRPPPFSPTSPASSPPSRPR